MALKILREIDPLQVKQLVFCIHSAPGVGKTSLGFTAEAPINLDFDGGVYRAAKRLDSVPIPKWDAVSEMSESDLAGYKTIVIDTAGRALDKLTQDILSKDQKNGRGGVLSIQGYGTLKGRFNAWLAMLKTWGKDIVLLAHSDEQRKGDETIERLDIQGGSKNEIYKSSDAMGRLSISDGRHILNFSPTETAFGKNPAELPVLEVPHPDNDPSFLARIIQQTKDRINELTADQKEVQAMLVEWKGKVDVAKKAGDFTKLVQEALKADPKVQGHAKSLIHTAARNAGLEFDTATKKYVEVKA